MNKLQNDLFLRACKGEETERTPVWIMRQAGRYLPQYRTIREKYDFLTMCKTPELAAQVTIQPVDIIGVDAAIIFSDILVIPEAMGMHLEMHEGKGPMFHNPVRTKDDVSRLKKIDPWKDLKVCYGCCLFIQKRIGRQSSSNRIQRFTLDIINLYGGRKRI